ncbi:tetratricopeptide (TPR) repeat protein [Mesorhizobium soli]|uniref:tetratricopeptide repeat protein n=1 Tax=Pseudaminobacter soli (ex Li et al. 2025) TaxID=1295366 RepID=UPI002474503D|nr:tetratricopeptide repeat protein [Mesorhizobium soli]MDH6230219.1 tetratricopeptide (TPR) repeat protein [Mesorhizobium soli]
MRRMSIGWLASVSALAGLMVIGQPVLAKQNEEPVKTSSLSGAYLAARVAEVDNDLDSAITYYKRALAFDTDNVDIQQSLMLALLAQGRFDESLPYAEKLKAVPDVERFSRLALAIDAIRKKDYKASDYLLKLTVESDLDRLITSVMTAWSKAGAGDTKEAMSYLEKLQGPDWYALFTTFHRALIADVSGKTQDADKIYQSLIGDVGSGGAAPETWLRAAEAYATSLAHRGEKKKALAVLDKADEFANGRLALVSLRAKIEKGEAVSPLIASPADGASEILVDLATALNRGGGEPFVRLYLQYALALKHDSDVALLQLAALAEQQDKPEEAIALYHRVPADSPLKRASELQLGLNLADLKRSDEAITHLKRLLEEAPDDMRAYLALGGVYASVEKYRDAADVYDKAVEKLKTPDKNDWNIFYQRGIAYERLKEWPKAEPNFREALKLMPDQPQVLNYLGYSWVDMNMNLDEGLEMIRKAVDLRPSDGYIVDSLGWAYYRLGRYDEAVKELERSVSLKPDDPVLNDHLGDAYWRVGRKLEAKFQWSHARDMKPEPDILASVLKKLTDGLPPLEGKASAQAPADKPDEPEAKPETPTEPQSDQKGEHELAPVQKISATPASYKVLPGQSLWSIATDVLGDGHRFQEILNLNPQLHGDPGRIVPGQELVMP